MQPPAGYKEDPMAFKGFQIEAAFCANVGVNSRPVAVLLRAIRITCWPLVVARFTFGSRSGTSGGSSSPVSVAVVTLCLLLAAITDSMTVRFLLDRRSPPALHESRKVRNFVWLLIVRMAAAVMMSPAQLPLFSAPWIAFWGAVDVVADQMRLTVALHMLPLSCLAASIVLVGRAMTSLAAAQGAVQIAVFGYLLPAAAIVCMELRSRQRFSGLHAAGTQAPLPPFWATAMAVLNGPAAHPTPCQRPAAAGQLQQSQTKPQTKQPSQAKPSTCVAANCVN